jgi:para-aminobenzoate synthetase component 1
MTRMPLVQDLEPRLEPAVAACRAASRPYTLWLDSALRHPEIGRYSFLAVDPFLVLRSRRGRAEILGPEGWRTGEVPPLAELERLLDGFRLPGTSANIPFQGGAAGFFGYELGRQLETLPRTRWREPELPELEIAFYDVVLGWDHLEGRSWLVSTGRPDAGAAARRRAGERARSVEAWLRGGDRPRPQLPHDDAPARPTRSSARDDSGPNGASGSGPESGPPSFPVPGRPDLRSTFSPGAYEEAVERAVEYILAGDVFQVNLSQRFRTPREAAGFDLYRRLRRRNAAPFAAFMTTASCSLASASPERFLKVTPQGVVETRPIKGTRPRSRHPAHDMYLERELEESGKDRAENLMIVDLLRNDLSRVCRPESVSVPRLFKKESYATVHHLVSVVTGRLEADRGRVDLLRAAFPGGSVTGAPKIRAMEIIAELEPVPRGPYCGSVGYLGFDGSVDTSITIRTLVGVGDELFFHAGGAVVADSDPRREYLETLDKAEGMIRALPGGGDARQPRSVLTR